MQRTRTLAILIGLTQIVGPSHAQDIGGDIADCPRRATTVNIVECLKEATEVWDRRLNVAYKAVMGKLAARPQEREALLREQRAWIRRRDSQCTSFSGGSLIQIETQGCFLDLTRTRTLELERPAC
jgi:uncharacterized protein YecT (DUF1311 family)